MLEETRIAELRDLYDTHQRAFVSATLSVREETKQAVRYLWRGEKAGAVLFTRLSEESADLEITAQQERFRELGFAVEWKYYSYDTPADLQRRLVQHRFEPDEREAVMVVEIGDAPERLLAPVTKDIRVATTRAEYAQADAICQAVWEGPPDAVTSHVWPLYQADPDGVSLYIAYADESPVSFGRLELPAGNPFGSIWGGSTLSEYRGRGFYTTLVAARLQEAARRGRKYLTVDAKPETSMPILEKLGFATIGYATAYNWAP